MITTWGAAGINADQGMPFELTVPGKSERHTLAVKGLLSSSAELNGMDPKLGSDGDVPKTAGAATAAGKLKLTPESITFVAIPGAGNAACP